MKANISRTAVGLLVLAVVFSLTVSSAAAAKGVEVTGRVERGKIVADNGRTYTLEHNARGRDLIANHTGQRVEVHGILSKTKSEDIIRVDRIDHIFSSVAAGKGVDLTGRVEGGKIVADNGEAYTLEHNARGRALIAGHTGQRVDVHGILSKSKTGEIIRVDRINHIYG